MTLRRLVFAASAAAACLFAAALAPRTPAAVTPAQPVESAPGPQAFVGARLVPVEGVPIEDGVLVVSGGRIVALGPRATTPVPPGALVRDLSGKVVIPGLVDTHSHIGGMSGGDSSGPLHPDVRVADTINPFDAGLRRAAAGGITTVNIMPGSGHLLSGQTVYVKTRRGRSIDDLAFPDVKGLPGTFLGGIKMANGTNSIGAPPFPGTRGKSAALQRDLFVRAGEYKDKLKAAGGDAGKRPARDLGLEAVVEALEGRRVVHFHTHRADDIDTVLRLSREFGFKVVLQHASEAWKLVDRIAAAKAPVSLILVDSPGGKLETREIAWETGGLLERAGVTVAFHTDDMITDSRFFLRMGALAVRAGMSREGALSALTLAGAKILELDARVGSLAVGKDADFVVLSGDPFATRTLVLETWIEGRRVFDRADPADALVAEGGYGAGEPRRPYLCCATEAGQ